ncbi:hypothetical protein L6452_05281 [Arctium lappa]|uniref:Uncharacterized protein n=1 Tax=Arctium lappa TaxID=4217 RepID=A0ACB9EGM7_ARCLA|nr:hypothetical protein L6452_05281 [Arctium lappa]
MGKGAVIGDRSRGWKAPSGCDRARSRGWKAPSGCDRALTASAVWVFAARKPCPWQQTIFGFVSLIHVYFFVVGLLFDSFFTAIFVLVVAATVTLVCPPGSHSDNHHVKKQWNNMPTKPAKLIYFQ